MNKENDGMDDLEPAFPLRTNQGEPLPLLLSSPVQGELSILGNTSAVFALGESLHGVLRITELSEDIDSIIIGIMESARLQREVTAGSDVGLIGAAISAAHSHDVGFKMKDSIFTRTVVAKRADWNVLFPSESDPIEIEFTLELPESAIPTLKRYHYGHSDGVWSNKEVRLSIDVACHLVVAVDMLERPEPKVVGSTSISLIGKHMTRHLQEEYEQDGALKLAWKHEHFQLRCLTPNPTIGRPLELELEINKLDLWRLVKKVTLCERLICAEIAPDAPNDDVESAVLRAPMLKSGRFPFMLASKQTRELDPRWYIDHPTHVQDWVPAPTNFDHYRAKITFFIPLDVRYQNAFENERLINFWMVVVKMHGGEEEHLGPLPIVWPSDIDTNLLEKEHHHHCSII